MWSPPYCWVNPSSPRFRAILWSSDNPRQAPVSPETSFFDMMWWCYFLMILVTFCDHLVTILWSFLWFGWHHCVMSFCDAMCWWFWWYFVIIFVVFWCAVCDKLVHVVKNVIFVSYCVFQWFRRCFVILVSVLFHVCGIICVKNPTCVCVVCLCYFGYIFVPFWGAKHAPKSDKFGSIFLCF